MKRRNNIDIDIYNGYQAFTTQGFTEANVKNGRQFYVQHEFVNIPTGETRNAIFTTGDENVLIKSRIIYTNSDNTLYEAFVNPTVTPATGTSLTVFNFNGQNPVATSVTAKHTATISNFGTRFTFTPIYGSVNSGNRSSGFFEIEGIERLLGKNVTYAVRITNRSTTNPLSVFVGFTWYEGPISGFEY